jgi:hypothetical protein
MSELWVAVTAEFCGATFSHRAQGPDTPIARDRVLRPFNHLLDEGATCVRSGLAGWLGPQTPAVSSETPVGTYHPPLSEHEKLREIEKIMDDAERDGSSETVARIRTVLCR